MPVWLNEVEVIHTPVNIFHISGPSHHINIPHQCLSVTGSAKFCLPSKKINYRSHFWVNSSELAPSNQPLILIPPYFVPICCTFTDIYGTRLYVLCSSKIYIYIY